MIERCTDPKCEYYGKPLVDRGWGFPVCQSTRRYSEHYPGSENKPLPDAFKGDVMDEHSTEGQD